MKKILMVTTIVAGSLFAISGANAYTFSGKVGKVKIVTPITLTGSDMDFGTVEKPTTANGSVTLDTAGATTTVDTTVVGGTPAAGDYLIKGAGDTIAITVEAASADVGLGLEDFSLKYGTASPVTGTGNSTILTGQLDPTAAGTVLKVGATLTIDGTTVGDGDQEATYNIAVVYE